MKKLVAIILALCLVFSLSATGFALAATESGAETANEPAVIADDEDDPGYKIAEVDNKNEIVYVDVSTALGLRNGVRIEEYPNYTLVARLTNDISMDVVGTGVSDYVSGWSHANTIIDGSKNKSAANGEADVNSETDRNDYYTITGPNGTDRQYNMFQVSSTSGYNTADTSLTIRNVNIDANGQILIYSSNSVGGKGLSVNLNNVHLKNLHGSGSSGTICLTGSNSYKIKSLNLDRVTTEDCTGTLIYTQYMDEEISIKNSDLSISMDENSGDFAYVIRTRYNGTNPNLTISNSEISYKDTSSAFVYAIYNQSYWSTTLEGSSIIGTGNNSSTCAYAAGDANGSLILKDCAIKNIDGTKAKINLNGYKSPVTAMGVVSGSPEIVLTNGTPVTLATSLTDWKEPLYYSFFSSIANSDVVVAQGNGTKGDEDYYALATADLKNLVYTDEDSIRSLELNEEDGKAYLNRVDIADCEVTMDTTDSKGNNANGNPIYERFPSDDALEPEVTVTFGDRELTTNYYSVAYGGQTTVPVDDDGNPTVEAGTMLDATAVVTPKGDLKGDDVEKAYQIEVAATIALTEDNTKTVLTYEDGVYDTEVTYYELDENGEKTGNGTPLTEGTDYKVVYTVNGATYTVTATVTGINHYVNSYDAVFNLPGRRTVKDEKTLNQALQDRVAYIEFENDIPVDNSVVADYDVVLDGNGHTLSAGGLETTMYSAADVAVVRATSGNVVLTDLTVEGSARARTLYVGNGASLTVSGNTIVQNGAVSGSGTVYGLAAYIDVGGVLTLSDCTVQNYAVENPTLGGNGIIYNLGTLNIQDGAYLYKLCSAQGAVYNEGTLNWSGGVFNTDTLTSYTNSADSIPGTVVANYGTFCMSGDALLNGFLLDEEEGYSEDSEKTKVCWGAIYNFRGATFEMSGGTIQGFSSTKEVDEEEERMNTNNDTYGGGVYNRGTFIMSGGEITFNDSDKAGGVCNYSGSESAIAEFTMTGGVISENTATVGGGVYSYNGNLYMSGGEISGNHLTEGIVEGAVNNEKMMEDRMEEISYIGSELCVAGSGEAVISGGTITGTELSLVAQYDENGEQTEETTEIGSAVAVVSVIKHSFFSGGVTGDSQRLNASLTVTGSPEISGGVTLVNFDSVSQPVVVTNINELNDLYNQGLVDLQDWTVYDWYIPGSYDENNVFVPDSGYEEGEDCTVAWLLLDGGLNVETPLDITTLTVDSYEIEFGISMTANNYLDGHTETTIRLNQDGDIVAEYLDRVTPDEGDGIGDGAMMSMTTTDGVNLLSQTYVERDIPYSIENQEGQNRHSYDTDVYHVAFEGWIVCSHPDGLVECASTESCTEEGCVAHYECPDCGKVFVATGGSSAGVPIVSETTRSAIVSEPLGHDPEYLKAAAPTCTEDGNIACYVCKRCGADLADDGTFSTVLTYEEVTDGYTLVAAGHEWELVDGQLPTCGEADGWTAGVQCKVCGEILLGLEEIEAGEGHDLQAVIEGSQVLYWVCTRCGQLFADADGTIPYVPEGSSSGSDEESGEPACEHDWIYTAGTPATCVDDGVADKYECSICGEVIGGETIKATGVHNMYSVAAQSATCTSDGHLAYQVCLNCLQFFTVNGAATTWDQLVVPAGHTLTYVSAKDATETTDGYIAHYECSVCGRYFSDAAGTKELSKTEITVAATGTSSGSVSASASASASSGSGNGSGSSSSSASSGKSGGSSSSSSSSSGSSSSGSSGSSSSTDSTLSSGTGTVRIASSGSSSGSSGSSGSSSGSSGVSVRSSSSSDEDADEDEETKSEKASSEDDAEESDERRSASVQDHTALNAKMYFDYEDLMNATDLALYNAGSSVSFSLSLNDLDEDDLDEDTAESMKSAYAETGSLISAHYLEIELIEKLDDMDISLSQTPGEIVIELAVPEEMLDQIAGTDGSFYVVRVHDGAADLLDAEFDSATDTVTFRTDKFSTFGLVYLEPLILTEEEEEAAPEEEPLASDFAESVVEEEESGGHAWVVWMIIAIVVVVVAAIVVAVLLRQKKQTAKKV